jgi:hypothetical protein
MPKIKSREIGIAADMHGCPNRCRHCGCGRMPDGNMTHDDLRWVAAQLREYVKLGEERPSIEKLWVMSSAREPDYSDDCEELARLEAELGNGKPARFELLSIWRLARDPQYAEWAKRIGPDTCQVTFFGLEETQDWFHRRRGAFRDSLRATERLLEVGMKPRWQFFLTKKILPDLAGLMGLVEKMRLRVRVAQLGSEFQMFIHAPCLIGEGRKIAHLSATMEDTALVPAELVESTRRHFKTEKIWTTEAETVGRILGGCEPERTVFDYPQPMLWFCVSSEWDVYPNMGCGAPWWRLGNLKKEPVAAVFDRFENDCIEPLRLNTADTLRYLAKRYGDPKSTRVVNDIERHWMERYCEEHVRRYSGRARCRFHCG